MSVPNIDFHRLARAAADVTTIAKGVSRKLATPKATPVSRQPPPLPGSVSGSPLISVSGTRGKVVGLSVTNKAFTQQGGGGGYIQQGTGYIAPVWAKTTHVRRTEFWLRDPRTGKETDYWLEGYDHVALREGQDVAVLCANGGTIVFVINYTAGQIYPIIPVERLLGPDLIANGSPASAWAIGGLIVALLVVGWSLSNGFTLLVDLGLLAAVGAVISTFVLHFRREGQTTRLNMERLARARAELDAACRPFIS